MKALFLLQKMAIFGFLVYSDRKTTTTAKPLWPLLNRYNLKGRYAHMYIFHFWLIDLDLWNAFCEASSWGSFLFTLQRQNKVCTPRDDVIIKIHKKLFSGIPINFTFFFISSKLVQRIWSWNFGFANRKIWAFIWYQKMYYFQFSPGEWESDLHKVIRRPYTLWLST